MGEQEEADPAQAPSQHEDPEAEAELAAEVGQLIADGDLDDAERAEVEDLLEQEEASAREKLQRVRAARDRLDPDEEEPEDDDGGEEPSLTERLKSWLNEPV